MGVDGVHRASCGDNDDDHDDVGDDSVRLRRGKYTSHTCIRREVYRAEMVANVRLTTAEPSCPQKRLSSDGIYKHKSAYSTMREMTSGNRDDFCVQRLERLESAFPSIIVKPARTDRLDEKES